MATVGTSSIRGFQKLLLDAQNAGVALDNSRESLEWLRKNYASMRPTDVTERQFRKDPDRRRSRPLPGRLYMFLYNPKMKNELPYWDRFPLVFPYKIIEGGFMGLNMHYIAPRYRAVLMDSLYNTINNTAFDETTRLRINYDLLNSASKYRWFKPCVKHYLTSHMASEFFYIHPEEWNLALFVPSEQFQKARKSAVWADSKGKFN